MVRLPPVVLNLILINVGMLLVPSLLGKQGIMTTLLGLRNPLSPLFSPLQLVSHMFMHAGLTHLFFNMLGLAVFGPRLEKVFGSGRFLFFYLVAGIGAGALYLGINYFELYPMITSADSFLAAPSPDKYVDFISTYHPAGYGPMLSFITQYSNNPDNPVIVEAARSIIRQLLEARVNVPLIGASGAVYGVLMLFALLFPNEQLVLFPIPIPVKVKYLVAVYGVLALSGSIQQQQGDNIAHLAHLGGMLFGLLFWALWRRDVAWLNRYY